MQVSLLRRIGLLFLSVLIIFGLTYLVILFAKGYRPNFNQKSIEPTGIFVATSNPDGAQIFLSGKLFSATNTTVNLPPGSYLVEVKKDGFQTWTKSLVIAAEVVTRIQPVLFPSVPSLKAITTVGASRPTLSPDGSKVFFLSPGIPTKLYTLDLTESPLGLLNRDPKLVSASLPPLTQVSWSPDSRQLLVTASSSATLIDLSTSQTTDVTATDTTIINDWKIRQKTIYDQRFSTLPIGLQPILASAAADLTWSPKEDKVLYIATASASLPIQLKAALPGSNTQTQERKLTPGHVYVYDLEEDRNFRIGEEQINGPKLAGWSWFPTSAHLIKVEDKKITIIEYDAQNPTVVYAGPMVDTYALPYPSGKQVLILTNLSPSVTIVPNLYAVSLK